jgi:hypothetical protein
MLVKRAAEIRSFSVDFTDKLHNDELLSGDVTVEQIGGTGTLTLSDAEIDADDLSLLTFPNDRIINGRFVKASRSIRFLVAGGTAGQTYTIRVTVGTDATAAQTLISDVQLRVN